jgi:hypothetical protein
MLKVKQLLLGDRASEYSENSVVLILIVIAGVGAVGAIGAKVTGLLDNVAGGL